MSIITSPKCFEVYNLHQKCKLKLNISIVFLRRYDYFSFKCRVFQSMPQHFVDVLVMHQSLTYLRASSLLLFKSPEMTFTVSKEELFFVSYTFTEIEVLQENKLF